MAKYLLSLITIHENFVIKELNNPLSACQTII
jgi:hypothetical protein